MRLICTAAASRDGFRVPHPVPRRLVREPANHLKSAGTDDELPSVNLAQHVAIRSTFHRSRVPTTTNFSPRSDRTANGLGFPGSCFHRRAPLSRSHAQMYDASVARRKNTTATCLFVAENSMWQTSQSVKLSCSATGHVFIARLFFSSSSPQFPEGHAASRPGRNSTTPAYSRLPTWRGAQSRAL